jgi:hypothetical protein
MDEKDVRKHLAALAHGHHRPEEHVGHAQYRQSEVP